MIAFPFLRSFRAFARLVGISFVPSKAITNTSFTYLYLPFLFGFRPHCRVASPRFFESGQVPSLTASERTTDRLLSFSDTHPIRWWSTSPKLFRGFNASDFSYPQRCLLGLAVVRTCGFVPMRSIENEPPGD